MARMSATDAALKDRQTIEHVIARHVESASLMAEAYAKAVPGNISVCIGLEGTAAAQIKTGLDRLDLSRES